MHLDILYGRSGTGKSTELLRRIGAWLDRDPDGLHYLLVPEQMSFQTEKRVLDQLGDRAGMKVRVMGVNRLAWHAFSETGGTAAGFLDKTGRHILLHHLIRRAAGELPLFSRSLPRSGFTAVVGEAVAEFKRYGVTPEMLSEQAGRMADHLSGQKLRELAILSRAYAAAMSDRVDSEDRLREAAARIERMQGLRGIRVWVDQFGSFSPMQMTLLQAVLRNSGGMTLSMLTDDPDGGHPLFRSANRAVAELERHAAENGIRVTRTSAGRRNLRHREGSALTRLEAQLLEPPGSAGKGFPDARHDDAVDIIRAENPYREIQFLCRRILKLCREDGMRFRDIAVLCPSAGPYDSLVAPMLRLHGIPCFVDERRTLADNPVSVAVTGLLDWIRGNWRHDDVIRVLRTSLLPLEPEETDRLENYLLACGIRGRRDWTGGDWTIPPQDPGVSLETLNGWRRLLTEPLAAFRTRVRGSMPADSVLRAFMDLLTDFDIPARVHRRALACRERGDLEAEAHARQVWRAFCGMMDQIHALLGDGRTNLNDLQQMLVAGFEGTETAIIPPSLDEVAVGGLERSRMATVKVLFIAGAMDGAFPPDATEGGILTDRERDLLAAGGVALAPNSRALAQERLNDVYLAVSAPTGRLILSWPAADMEGKGMRPAPLLHRMRGVLPGLRETAAADLPEMSERFLTTPGATLFDLSGPFSPAAEAAEDPLLDAVLGWFEQHPSWRDRAARVLSGRTPDNRPQPLDPDWLDAFSASAVFTSASALELYRRCPFSHYAQSRLKLEERRDDVFRASDFGSVMHRVMENAVRLVGPDPEAWDRMDEPETERLAAEAVEGWEAVRRTQAPMPPGYAAWYRRRLTRAAVQAIGAVAHHIRSGRFRPVMQELTFGRDGTYPALELQLEDGGAMFLQGRLDRLDAWSEGGVTWLRVVDYKSGGRTMTLSDNVEGLDIQLAAYLSAALNHHRSRGEDVRPGGLFFMRLEPPEIGMRTDSAEATGRERRKRMKLTGFVLEDLAVATAMDEMLRGGGSSDVVPVMRKADGTFGSRSKTLTESDFGCLLDTVRRGMAKTGLELRRGRIDIRPVRTETSRACEYCPYGTFCAFEPGIGGVGWERVRTRPDGEILERWRSEQEGGTNHGHVDG